MAITMHKFNDGGYIEWDTLPIYADEGSFWIHNGYQEPNFYWIPEAITEWVNYHQTYVKTVFQQLSELENQKMPRTYTTQIFMERREGGFHETPFIEFFAAPPNFYWIYEAVFWASSLEVKAVGS